MLVIWNTVTDFMGTSQLSHVRCWWFDSQSLISWVHYILAMSDVGDLKYSYWFHGYITAEPCQMLVIWLSVTDFMGTLHISHVRCWLFESQSLIQWVLCRWALWDDGHLISDSDSVGTLQMNQVLTVLSRCLTEPQKKKLLSVLEQELQGSRYTWLMSCVNSCWQLLSQENKHWSWV